MSINRFKSTSTPPASQVENRFKQLNTDPSLDTIFWAMWAGALGYGVARQGFEFSVASSVGISLVCGVVAYGQFWKVAVQNAANLTGQFGLNTYIKPVIN